MTGPKPGHSQIATDLIQPFQVERTGLRGRFLRVGPLLNTVLGHHDYPVPVANLLGETIIMAGLLGSTLKYDGVFTLQLKGDGPVDMIVADMTSAGVIRGYARFDGDAVAARDPGASPVSGLLGSGHLAFTADQGVDTDRYQGIVELEGATLADCVHHYFRQSEQIHAAIKTGLRQNDDGIWSGGAMMVQRLPGDEGASPFSEADHEEGWREAVVLMGSVTTEELADAAMAPHRLLYRLFNEPGVRAFAPRGITAGCRCSREKVAKTLGAFPRDEIMALMEDGCVRVNCEFCGAVYVFDDAGIGALFP